MGKVTGISWTDHSFNPWWGCTKVSAGCDNCYAEAFDKRVGGAHWGKGAPRREFSDKHWREPLCWDQNAERDKVRRKVFCASMADVMDDEAPDGARERLWDLINNTPHLVWQLLTKRPHRYSRYLPKKFMFNNVWYGTTAENQEHFDVRFPIVKEVAIQRGGIDWISYEPAIGPLSIIRSPRSGFYYNLRPDWVIFGGESGNVRRPCERVWLEGLVHEVRTESPETALFVKQMGGRTPAEGKAAISVEFNIQEFPTEPY